jgi:hypothetical protein
MDRHALDRRGHSTSPMHQGEQIGSGEDLAEYFQAALAAAHTCEPIMDEGNSHCSPLHLTL